MLILMSLKQSMNEEKTMLKSKRVIILASGASVRQGAWNIPVSKLPLWDVLKNEVCFSINWSSFFFKPTVGMFSDYAFYVTQQNWLNKLPMLISVWNAYYDRCKDPYRDEERCEIGDNLILLQPNGKFYHKEDSWKLGFYSPQLASIWVINFALRCGFEEIFLLGLDGKSINGYTHFYEDIPDLGTYTWKNQKQCGIGFKKDGSYRTQNYNKPKDLNSIYYKPFEDEKNKIANVSPDSAINIFQKIDYDEFFSHLYWNHQKINQDEIRKEIKDLINAKSGK